MFSSKYWNVRLLIISPILLLGTVFLVLKLNGNITWNWGVIFVPEWVCLSFWMIYIIYRFVKGIRAENRGHHQQTGEWTFLMFTIFGWVCLSLYLIFITIHLETGSWPWPVIFCPIWILIAVGMVCSIFVSEGRACHLTVLSWLSWMHFGVISILVTIQLMKSIDNRWNWAIVFIPVWTILGIWIWAILVSVSSVANHEKTRKTITYVSNTSTGQSRPLPVTIRWESITYVDVSFFVIIWICVALFMILLTIELEHPTTIGILGLFSPIICMFGLLFVFCYMFNCYHAHWRSQNVLMAWQHQHPPIIISKYDTKHASQRQTAGITIQNNTNGNTEEEDDDDDEDENVVSTI